MVKLKTRLKWLMVYYFPKSVQLQFQFPLTLLWFWLFEKITSFYNCGFRTLPLPITTEQQTDIKFLDRLEKS